MTAHFAEVLETEFRILRSVQDAEGLTRWKAHIVDAVMCSPSPYDRVMAGETCRAEREAFLQDWSVMLTEAIDRARAVSPDAVTRCEAGPSEVASKSSEDVALLILAAVHGGRLLSRVDLDQQPLESALDLALASLMPERSRDRVSPDTDPLISNMDM